MAAPATLVFGTMRVAGREMAISADAMQEVVAWPPHVTLPLQSSEMVRGLFDLRGQAVPIVTLSRLLGRAEGGPGGSEAPADASGNIAVLRTPKGCLGLAVDSIGGVLRVAADQVQDFAGASGGAEASLMRGLLRKAGEPAVPILNETALAAVPGLLFLPAMAAKLGDAAQLAMRTHLVFACGDWRFCVDATCVREIIDTPEIEAGAVRNDMYRGIARVRGGAAAALDLLTLLALPNRGAARTRLLVLETDDGVVGLAISDIVTIRRRHADDVLSLPEYGAIRRDLILGLMEAAAPEEPDVIVLSHAAIMRDREVAAIRRLHADIRRVSAQSGTRMAYLKVDAGLGLYVKLSECAEIVPMAERPLRLGAIDATYLGLLRRGTQTWPLIRLRTLLDGADGNGADGNGADGGAPPGARVLVVRGARGGFGFVVESVQAIEYIAVREDLGSTPAEGMVRDAAMCAVMRKIWIDSPEGPRLRMVVDLTALAGQLGAADAA
jgi:chemotaxis signal transduction protein